MSVYEIVFKRLAEAMEKGIVPWESPYTAKNNGHRNISGRRYTGVNVLLLNVIAQLSGYEYPVWLTFHQIQEKGWHIMKGECSAIVTFYKMIDVEVENETDAGVETVVEQKPIYRYYHVFNIQQLEEFEEIKEKFQTKELQPQVEPDNNLVHDYIENAGITLEYAQYGTSYYFPAKDKIVMSPVKPDSYLGVLSHEAIHSTGHPKRLHRFGIGFEEEGDYSFEELVAEIGSAFLLSRMGQKINYENKAAYLKSWSQFLKSNKKSMLVKASAEAEKAAEFIINIAKQSKQKVA